MSGKKGSGKGPTLASQGLTSIKGVQNNRFRLFALDGNPGDFRPHKGAPSPTKYAEWPILLRRDLKDNSWVIENLELDQPGQQSIIARSLTKNEWVEWVDWEWDEGMDTGPMDKFRQFSNGPMGRGEKISRQLSSSLRHSGKKEGLIIDAAGYVHVQELLSHPIYKRLVSDPPLDVPELRFIVNHNEKKRFSIDFLPIDNNYIDPDFTLGYCDKIRANQGHSASLGICSEHLLTKIHDPRDVPHCYHGTYYAAWSEIQNSKGLHTMGRQHIHFTTSVPEIMKNKPGQLQGRACVISGMRTDCQIVVSIDVEKAMNYGGLKFYRSANGVILTEGDQEGFVLKEYFKEVVDRRNDKVIWRPKGPGGGTSSSSSISGGSHGSLSTANLNTNQSINLNADGPSSTSGTGGSRILSTYSKGLRGNDQSTMKLKQNQIQSQVPNRVGNQRYNELAESDEEDGINDDDRMEISSNYQNDIMSDSSKRQDHLTQKNVLKPASSKKTNMTIKQKAALNSNGISAVSQTPNNIISSNANYTKSQHTNGDNRLNTVTDDRRHKAYGQQQGQASWAKPNEPGRDILTESDSSDEDESRHKKFKDKYKPKSRSESDSNKRIETSEISRSTQDDNEAFDRVQQSNGRNSDLSQSEVTQNDYGENVKEKKSKKSKHNNFKSHKKKSDSDSKQYKNDPNQIKTNDNTNGHENHNDNQCHSNVDQTVESSKSTVRSLVESESVSDMMKTQKHVDSFEIEDIQVADNNGVSAQPQNNTHIDTIQKDVDKNLQTHNSQNNNMMIDSGDKKPQLISKKAKKSKKRHNGDADADNNDCEHMIDKPRMSDIQMTDNVSIKGSPGRNSNSNRNFRQNDGAQNQRKDNNPLKHVPNSSQNMPNHNQHQNNQYNNSTNRNQSNNGQTYYNNDNQYTNNQNTGYQNRNQNFHNSNASSSSGWQDRNYDGNSNSNWQNYNWYNGRNWWPQNGSWSNSNWTNNKNYNQQQHSNQNRNNGHDNYQYNSQ